MKHSVLATRNVDNTNADPNNIVLTIKGTKLNVSALTLSEKGHQVITSLWIEKTFMNNHSTLI